MATATIGTSHINPCFSRFPHPFLYFKFKQIRPFKTNTPSDSRSSSRVVRFSQFEEHQQTGDWRQQSGNGTNQAQQQQQQQPYLPTLYQQSSSGSRAMSNDRIEIKETDMKPNMVTQGMDIVRDGLQKFTQDKDIASYIKDTFEQRFGPTWHCVVGKSFGSRVSYELETFALLKVGQHTVLVFKCG